MADRTNRDKERGRRLRALREDGDFSAIHIAEQIEVSKGRIYAWEKGEPISSQNLSALAEALGSSRRYILSGQADQAPLGLEASVQAILEKLTQIEARQAELQADVARVLVRQGDLLSSRERGGRSGVGEG